MSGWLIAVTGLIYFCVSLEQAFKHGNIPMSVVYFGYSFSNIGLYYLATVTKNVSG